MLLSSVAAGERTEATFGEGVEMTSPAFCGFWILTFPNKTKQESTKRAQVRFSCCCLKCFGARAQSGSFHQRLVQMKAKKSQRGCEPVISGGGGGLANNFHVSAPPSTPEESGDEERSDGEGGGVMTIQPSTLTSDDAGMARLQTLPFTAHFSITT